MARRPTGRMYLDICWEPVHDEAGGVIGVASATVDLTPIKQAEEAVLEAERARTRLAQALTSEIAHRTKNNLAIVAGLLQLQMGRETGPDSPADV